MILRRFVQALDHALDISRQLGLRLIVPFVDQWEWIGGIKQYAKFRGFTVRAAVVVMVMVMISSRRREENGRVVMIMTTAKDDDDASVTLIESHMIILTSSPM
jgi:hypothetical protein